MNQLVTYQKFFSEEEAEPLIVLLKEHQVPYKFFKSTNKFDRIIGGGGVDELYEIQLPPAFFTQVDQLIHQQITIPIEDLDLDHYLLSFTEKELKEIVSNPDEWGKQDYLLAIHLLKDRGIVYTEAELEKLKNDKIQLLAKPEKEPRAWIYTGYFFAVLGGFFGVLIGLALMQSTKTLPNGKKMYTYDPQTRKRGKRIVIISSIIFLVSLALKLSNAYMYWLDLFYPYN